jgi:uncharacterized membrane protein
MLAKSDLVPVIDVAIVGVFAPVFAVAVAVDDLADAVDAVDASCSAGLA